MLSNRVEGLLNPVQSGWLATTDGDHVETAGTLPVSGVMLQKVLGGARYFSLFAKGDAGRTAAVARRAPVTDFNEHQRPTVEHHQVDLTAAAGVVSGYRPQSAPL